MITPLFPNITAPLFPGISTPLFPKTWWLTGLSGAGKTTLARALADKLGQQGLQVCVLDGDHLRQGLCSDLGFSLAERAENMRRVAEVARLLNDTGVHAITALISPSQAGRDKARAIIGERCFIEAHIATPLAICQQRDPKGLYARARADAGFELTGIRSPYEVPQAPDIVIDTSAITVEKAVEMLLAAPALLHCNT
jgi:adenylylsulfate kinase